MIFLVLAVWLLATLFGISLAVVAGRADQEAGRK